MELLNRGEKENKRKTVVVAITSDPESMVALDAACKISKADKSQVVLFYVAEVDPSQSLEDSQEEHSLEGTRKIKEACDRAKKLGVRIDPDNTDILQERRGTGTAIVDEARFLKANAIYISARAQNDFGRREINPLAVNVLKRASCSVHLIQMPEL